MPPVLKQSFESLRLFLRSDSPTNQETRSALNLIYMLCFGSQAVLSLSLAGILAILSQFVVQEVASSSVQATNISQIMLFSVMVLLLPSAFLTASLWQRRKAIEENSQVAKKYAKQASIASTIAVAVILAISVWLCVFAYFISVNVQALFLLIIFSIVLYFCGFIATGIYAKSVT